jgi:hypothetical protein
MLAFLQQQPPPGHITWVTPEAHRQSTIGDQLHALGSLILSSIGLVGALIVLAALAGGVMAFLMVRWHRRHPPEEDRLPPVSPFIPG